MELPYWFVVFLTSAMFSSNNRLTHASNYWIPKTNEELANALCSSYDSKGYCSDYEVRVIVINKVFDFTGTKGIATEVGCYHSSTQECLIRGQKKLNMNNQCYGLKQTWVTYDKAGVHPLIVGSNKYIISIGGSLKGIGLKICNNQNVFIYGLSITDINPEVIWGGDAITLDKVWNVWIHRCYFSRIGRQMIVSGHNACQGVTISYNEFDGRTPYSAYCDGHHYWLWLFEGSDDTITLYYNYVHHTSGRGAHVTGLDNSKVLMHMTTNKFENIFDSGLVEAYDPTARILMEGNTFNNVSYVVKKNGGHITYPYSKNDADYCKPYLGRSCYLNTAIKSGGFDFKRDDVTLKELYYYNTIQTNVVNNFDSFFNKYKYNYADVDKYVSVINKAQRFVRLQKKNFNTHKAKPKYKI